MQPEVRITMPEMAAALDRRTSASFDTVDLHRRISDTKCATPPLLHRQGGLYQHANDHSGKS